MQTLATLAGLASLVAAIGALPARAETKAQTVSGVSWVTLQVEAGNDEWTPTDMTVAVDDFLVLTVGFEVVVGKDIFGGEFKRGPWGSITAARTKIGHDVEPDEGALLVKVGSGSAKTVGTDYAFPAAQSGIVKFRVHAKDYTKCSGAFSVLLIRIPKAMVPKEWSQGAGGP